MRLRAVGNIGWKIVAVLMSAWQMSVGTASAQGSSYYEDVQYDPYQRRLYFVGEERPHTSLKSYKMDELREYFDPDSVLYEGIGRLVNTRARIVNDFCKGDFLHWTSKDSAVRVAINPMMDFEVGSDKNQTRSRTTWTNSRGFYLDGNLGKNFWFYLDFTENQAIMSDYMMNVLDSLRTMPCTAHVRHINGMGKEFDYMTSTGYICFNAGEWIDFQVGKTHTFVGDGYRSLLLSDASEPVPTFKMNVTFLGAKYMMMVSQLRAAENKVSNNGDKAKYSFSHYLDWNMGKRFTLGVFENITQATWRKTGETRGIDWEYLNPFIVFRPGELSAGSPDNVLIGMTSKFVCNNYVTVYGQFFFDEFRIKDLVHNPHSWTNKYGFQIGARATNIFNVEGLDALVEMNRVRPYCYSQFDGMGTYMHKKLCMGHPLGANLKEGLGVLNYKHGRVSARLEVVGTKYGDDFPKDSVSYGHNPLINSTKRVSSRDVRTLQGLETKLLYVNLNGAFIINPKTMMTLTAGVRLRKRESERTKEDSKQVYVALRWNIRPRNFSY